MAKFIDELGFGVFNEVEDEVPDHARVGRGAVHDYEATVVRRIDAKRRRRPSVREVEEIIRAVRRATSWSGGQGRSTTCKTNDTIDRNADVATLLR